MSISLLLMLVVLSTQHNTGHAVSPCAFDAASISSIEKWWKGDGDLLRNMDLHCLSKTAGQIGGGVAGAAAGSTLGGWLGRRLGETIGFGDTGERMGAMYGFNLGLTKGAELGGELGVSINLASLLDWKTGADGDTGNHDRDDNDGNKYSHHSKHDSKAQMRDKCYHTLGVTRRATQKDIKSAYRRLAKEAHPDKHGGKHEHMVQLNLCYEIVLLANTGSTSRGGGTDL